MKLSEKIKQKHLTPTQMMAKKHNVNIHYVYAIAEGKRTPIRGKGLAILNDLKKMAE